MNAAEVSDMQLRSSADRYGAIAQSLHWFTVILVMAAWALGTFDDVLPRGAARRAGLFVHISAGLAILAVLAARVPWRLMDPPPPPEPTIFGVWGDRASRLAHYTLYALLVAVPIAGIVLQFARGQALPLFGLADFASPWTADRAFARSVKEVHELLANALLIMAALHAGAALFHHWAFRDRTLARMLPGAGP
jgi:cytochrome b561